MNTRCNHKNLGMKRKSINNPKTARNEYIINKWLAVQVNLSWPEYHMQWLMDYSFYTSSQSLMALFLYLSSTFFKHSNYFYELQREVIVNQIKHEIKHMLTML